MKGVKLDHLAVPLRTDSRSNGAYRIGWRSVAHVTPHVGLATAVLFFARSRIVSRIICFLAR